MFRYTTFPMPVLHSFGAYVLRLPLLLCPFLNRRSWPHLSNLSRSSPQPQAQSRLGVSTAASAMSPIFMLLFQKHIDGSIYNLSITFPYFLCFLYLLKCIV